MTTGVLPTASPADVRARAARLLRPRAVGVALVVGLTGASTAATLAGPALIGVVVDAAAGGGGRRTIDRAALAYAVLALAGALLRYLAEVRAAVVGESALAELRTEVFDHALDAPVDLIERAGTGELVVRVTADVTVLARAMRTTVPRVAFASVELVLTVVALVLVDARLATAAIVVAIPVGGLACRWYFLHAPARYRAERERHAELGSMLLESYRGRATLAAHRATTRRRLELARRGRAVVDAELASTSARNRFRPAIRISQAMSLVVVVALGTKFVADGTATVGAVSAAALYLVRMFDPAAALLEEADEVQQATASLARLVGVMQLPSERGSDGGRLPSVGGAVAAAGGVDIHVSGVDFAYETSAPVLVAVEFAVDAGERVVVVGPSGAGKTTLAKLVAGTHRPDRGVVRLGGVLVDDLDPATRSRVVAMVAQESHTFGRTVADNVRLGRLDASHPRRCAPPSRPSTPWVGSMPSRSASTRGSAPIITT